MPSGGFVAQASTGPSPLGGCPDVLGQPLIARRYRRLSSPNAFGVVRHRFENAFARRAGEETAGRRYALLRVYRWADVAYDPRERMN